MALLPSIDDIERHQVYWLEDGNIILVLEDRIAFRIYRGHLARHSLVFADMLALSPSSMRNGHSDKGEAIVEPPEFQGSSSPHSNLKPRNNAEEQEYYAGIPVLRLPQDRAEDFAALFDVVLQITPADPSFNMLEGVLRISTKYLFDGKSYSPNFKTSKLATYSSIPGIRAWAVEHMQARLPTTLHDLLADPTLGSSYSHFFDV